MKKKDIYVLVSTTLSNFNKIKFSHYPSSEGVFYLFSVQCKNNEEIKSLICHHMPKRSDITIYPEHSQGLSSNRNALLKKVTTGLGIIADDDVKYETETFENIRRVYQKANGVDFITFKIRTPQEESKEYKKYRKANITHNFLSLMKVSSIEITFDIEKVNQSNVCFDTRFGLGSQNIPKFEESIFLNDLRRKGLKGLFVNEYIVTHPYESSGKTTGYTNSFQVQEKFCFFFRYFGAWGSVAILAFLLKNPSILRFGITNLVKAFHRGCKYKK